MERTIEKLEARIKLLEKFIAMNGVDDTYCQGCQQGWADSGGRTIQHEPDCLVIECQQKSGFTENGLIQFLSTNVDKSA